MERKSRFDIRLNFRSPVLPKVAAVVSDSREAPLVIIPWIQSNENDIHDGPAGGYWAPQLFHEAFQGGISAKPCGLAGELGRFVTGIGTCVLTGRCGPSYFCSWKISNQTLTWAIKKIRISATDLSIFPGRVPTYCQAGHYFVFSCFCMWVPVAWWSGRPIRVRGKLKKAP